MFLRVSFAAERFYITMKNKRKRAEPVIEQVDEAQEVDELEAQVVATAPARGTQPFTESTGDRQPFTSLPLSQRTTRGLTGGGFKTMTEIQVRNSHSPMYTPATEL